MCRAEKGGWKMQVSARTMAGSWRDMDKKTSNSEHDRKKELPASAMVWVCVYREMWKKRRRK
jgi:hypothetical protein